MTVPCWVTSIAINKGHRIRVTLTSSNYPRFDVNPGTAKPPTDGGPRHKQTNRIYCDRAYPSHILLPVIPTAEAATDRRPRPKAVGLPRFSEAGT